MKRVFSIALLLCLIVCFLFQLSGCSGHQEEIPVSRNDILNVYATFYPFYAFADMVIGDVEDVRLNCLVQPQDGCLRNYQLSDWDLSLLSRSADAVIAGGRGLESFESLLYALGENGPAVSSVLYDLELQKFSAANARQDSDSHWNSENPHIYMSIDGAIELTNRIAAVMQFLDHENSDAYLKNAEVAKEKLRKLSDEIHAIVGAHPGTKVAVFSEPLVYTAKEYSLDTVLCFDRESGEELRGSDLESCIDLLRKSGARVILIEKQAPQALCTALEGSGFILAPMDTLSTRRANDGYEGYFDAQRENAYALNKALTAANQAS